MVFTLPFFQMPTMKTQDFGTKIITTKPKNVRNCESWASGAMWGAGLRIRESSVHERTSDLRPDARQCLPNQFQSKLNLSRGCRDAGDGSGCAGDFCA